jgi:hypothetical protein
MAFTQESNITKVGIEDFEITFFVPGPNNGDDVQSGRLSFQIRLSDGSIQPKSGVDLIARLQDDAAGLTHLANLVSLRNYIITRLNNEVLPP